MMVIMETSKKKNKGKGKRNQNLLAGWALPVAKRKEKIDRESLI